MTKTVPNANGRPDPIARSALAPIRMTTGGERRHPYVIDAGQVYHWVGIYWIKLREATENDYKAFPEVKG